jgi:hypothetical protein
MVAIATAGAEGVRPVRNPTSIDERSRDSV